MLSGAMRSKSLLVDMMRCDFIDWYFDANIERVFYIVMVNMVAMYEIGVLMYEMHQRHTNIIHAQLNTQK